MSQQPLWYPSNDLVAQLAHFFAGLGAPLLALTLWHASIAPVVTFAAFVAYAALKEFVFDALVEKQPTSANARDFTFYALGLAVAMTAWHFH